MEGTALTVEVTCLADVRESPRTGTAVAKRAMDSNLASFC